LKENKIRKELWQTSDSEFWLECRYGFLTAKFCVDDARAHGNHQVLYDVFSPKHDVHLKEEPLRDIEKLDMVMEEKGKGEYEKSIEDFLLILDCVKLWARKNKFGIKEKEMI